MYNLEIKDNYLYITNTDSQKVTDRDISEIEIVKHTINGTLYTVRYRGVIIDNLRDIPLSEFVLNGVPFASQQAFEDWKNLNTGNSSSSGGGGNVVVTNTPLDVTQETINKTPTHYRASGNNTYSQPFVAFSVTAYSNDVTVNGESIERGQVVNLDHQSNSVYVVDQVVTGSDYFITYTV